MRFSKNKTLLLIALVLLAVAQEAPEDGEAEVRQEEEENPDDPLYEPTGLCNKPGCVPFAKFTFAKIWEENPPQKAAATINEKIESSANVHQGIEARPVVTRGGFESVAIFAKEDIKIGTVLGSFRGLDALNTNSFSFELFSEDFPLRRQQRRFSKVKFTDHDDKFSFVLNLLVHLYYFDYSLLQADLLMLPRHLQTPYFRLNNYEIDNFLKGDEAQGFFKMRLHGFRNAYSDFTKGIITSWTKEDIKKLFGFSKIPYQDFVYAFSIIWDRVPFYKFLVPFFHNNFYSLETKDIETAISPFQYEEGKNLTVYAQRNFSAGELLKIDMLNPSPEFYLGIGDVHSGFTPWDCISVIVFKNIDSTRIPDYEKGSSCYSIPKVPYYYMLTSFLNMNMDELVDCTQKIRAKIGKFPPDYHPEKINITIEECAHPQRNYGDGIKFARLQFEEREANYGHHIALIKDYIELRKEHKKSIESTLVLQQYLRNRWELSKALIKELKKYEKMFKTKRAEYLERLNSDKRKQKEQADEKIEL